LAKAKNAARCDRWIHLVPKNANKVGSQPIEV
jgi:hypothetical protein